MGDVVNMRGGDGAGGSDGAGPIITHKRHKPCGRMIPVDRLIEHAERCARQRAPGETSGGATEDNEATTIEPEVMAEPVGLGAALRDAASRADRIEAAGNKLVNIAGDLLGELAEVGEKALTTGSKVMDRVDAVGAKVKRVTGWDETSTDGDEDED